MDEQKQQNESSIPVADEESLWTPEDVARYLQVPRSWVYDATRKRAKRHLPHLKVGRYPRFRREDVIAFANGLKRDYQRQGRAN